MTEPARFTCGVEYEQPGPVCVLTLCGMLEVDYVDQFEAVVEKELRSGAKRFVIDMGQLSYVGSLGLRVIVALHRKVKGDGAVCVFNPTPAVQTVLDIVKLGQVLRILPTRADALDAVRN